MKIVVALLLIMSALQNVSASPITLLKSPSGDEYGYRSAGNPGRLAIILTTDIAASLNDEYSPIGSALYRAGYVVASVDVPCHGQDAPTRVRQAFDRLTTGKPPGVGLDCWARRVRDSSSDVFAPFLDSIKRVITDIQSRGLASARGVVVIGVSRGGYLALRAAAADARITDVVGFAPVTDLSRLSEFAGQKVNGDLYALDHLAGALARKHLFLQIGSNDDRVGTHELLHFVDVVTAAARSNTLALTLSILPLKGHATAEHDRAASWILEGRRGAAGAPPPK